MCYTYRRAGEPLEKEGNAISNKDDADEQRNTPTAHVVSELQIPAAVVDRYEAHERKKSRLEHAKLVVEALALVAVIFYAGITYFQLAEMRQTTWLAFHDRLEKISAALVEADKRVQNAPVPARRPLSESGKAPTTGEPWQDQKSRASEGPKSGGGVSGPQHKAAVAPAPVKKAESVPLEPRAGLEKAGGHEKRGDDGSYDWNKLATVTNAIAAAIIALFTWRLVRFTRRQADATQASAAAAAKSAAAAENSVSAMQASTAVADAALAHARVTAAAQLEEARRANKLTLRAWVLAEDIKVIDLTAEMAKPAVRLKIRNYGKLPATKWARSHEFLVGNSVLVDPPPPHGSIRERQGGRVIAAGQAYTTSLFLDSPDGALRDQIDAVLSGSAPGIVWLVIRFTYTDALDSEGDSSYCWRFFKDRSSGKVRAIEHPILGFGVS